jgi:hypothetical protein
LLSFTVYLVRKANDPLAAAWIQSGYFHQHRVGIGPKPRVFTLVLPSAADFCH